MSKAFDLQVTSRWLEMGFAALEKAASQILLDCAYGFQHDHSGEEAAHRLVNNFHQTTVGVVGNVLTGIQELPTEQQRYARDYVRDLQLLDSLITSLAHEPKIDLAVVRKAYDELGRLREENPKVRAFYEEASAKMGSVGIASDAGLRAERITELERRTNVDRRTGTDRRTT